MTERKDTKGEIANDKPVESQVPERIEEEGSVGLSAAELEGVPTEGKTVVQQEESDAPNVSEREKELERKLEETKKKLESAEKEEKRWHEAYDEANAGKNEVEKREKYTGEVFSELDRMRKANDNVEFYKYAEKIARWKLESEVYLLSKSNARKFEDAVNRLEEEKGIWTEKNKSLERDLQDARGVNESLEMRVKSIDVEKGKIEEEKQQLVAKVEAQKKFQDEIVERIIPGCLALNAPGFVENLRIEACGEMNFDAALLVLAEFSKFAVMERSDAAELVDWQNQLSDIGLVVAKYFHSQQIPEEDVVIQMKDLAAVLLCSPKPSELGIQLIVPELGEGFSTDEVTHKNSGTRVSKVLNWCVKGARGGVYSKAIVE
jgi:hypothetical protein